MLMAIKSIEKGTFMLERTGDKGMSCNEMMSNGFNENRMTLNAIQFSSLFKANQLKIYGRLLRRVFENSKCEKRKSLAKSTAQN